MTPSIRQRNFGCKLSLGLFVLLLSLFCFSGSLFAQGGVDGSGGPLVDIELQEVCDDGTVAFQVLQFVVGVSDPVLLGYVDAAGAAYTLSGGTLTAGPCTGSGSAGPDYSIEILSLCDDGTPFYRVVTYTGTNLSFSLNFELDLTTIYTPSGTVYAGPCAATATASITRTISTTTGSITAGAIGFEICNEGTSNGTVTIGGGSVANLIPGSCTSYRAVYNPATRQYLVAPAVTYVATGTSFSVIVQN